MSSKRLLTSEEIQDIVSYMMKNDETKYKLQMKYKKSRYLIKVIKDLETTPFYPELIPQLKEQQYDAYQNSLIDAGEMVGSLASQCIGQPFTQMFLNTFHLAGVIQKQSTGTGRLNDLLNATANLKHPAMEFRMKSRIQGEIVSSRERCIVRNKIEYKILLYFVANICVYETIPEKYNSLVQAYEIIHRSLPKNFVVIEFFLDKMSMYKYTMDPNNFVRNIRENYDDIDAFYVPSNPSIIVVVNIEDVDIDISGAELHKPVYVENYMIDRYLLYVIIPKLYDEYVSGIENIKHVDIREKKDGYLYIQTTGSNLKDVRMLEDIDVDTVLTNDLYETFKSYGISATREFLLNEYRKLAPEEYVEARHVELLVDSSTYGVKPTPVSRNGMDVSITDPMAKASFEQPFEVFRKAAATGQEDQQKSVSSSIVVGTFKNFGTLSGDHTININ